MLEGRYQVNAWNWFYTVFSTPLKNMAEEANLSAWPQYK